MLIITDLRLNLISSSDEEMFAGNELLERLFLQARSFASEENWEQAASAYQQVLDSGPSESITPQLRFSATVYKADCLVQMELFDEARQLLESLEIIELSIDLEASSINIEYHMVYAHAISSSEKFEKIDHHLQVALRLAQQTNEPFQIESVVISMLYMGRSFMNWNYLLSCSHLASEFSRKLESSLLATYSKASQAEACRELGRYDEAVAVANQLKNQYREAKNVDEYTHWSQFVTDIEDRLPKPASQGQFLDTDEFSEKITIEELPQAGDFKSSTTEMNLEDLTAQIDLPDAVIYMDAFGTVEFDQIESVDQTAVLEPVNSTDSPTPNKRIENSESINNLDQSERRRIAPSKLIAIPQIYGLPKRLSKLVQKSDSHRPNSPPSEVSQTVMQAVHEYTLECFYFEIYKKGSVTAAEKAALQNLFGLLQIERPKAAEILKIVMQRVNPSHNQQTNFSIFLNKVHLRTLESLSEGTRIEFMRQIAGAINRLELLKDLISS